ncbi:hypothetical protein Agub_g14025, partial [Astrephomene gubernaculifera]
MSALTCCTKIAHPTCGRSTQLSRRARIVLPRAVEPKQQQGASPSTNGTAAAEDSKPTFTREFTSYGARIVESDGKLTGPEDEKDFWEGENMETLGKLVERYFLPALVVLGLLAGGIAARSYNENADVFLAPPSGPDADVRVVPAGALAPTTVVAAPEVG